MYIKIKFANHQNKKYYIYIKMLFANIINFTIEN